ncbi:MAG: hypothetical protein NEHIOOID_00831 [Holosporales bacterium]
MKKFTTHISWKKKIAAAFFIFSSSLISASENNEIDLYSLTEKSTDTQNNSIKKRAFMEIKRDIMTIMQKIENPNFNGTIDFQDAEKIIKYYFKLAEIPSNPVYFLKTYVKNKGKNQEDTNQKSRKPAHEYPKETNIIYTDENGTDITRRFNACIKRIQEIIIPLKNAYFYKKMRNDIPQSPETLRIGDPGRSHEASIFLKIFGILFHDKKIVLDCGNESEIDHGCLQGLRDVKSITILGPHVNKIGEFFLAGCTDLEEINFSGLNNVRTIGQYFMFRCTKLKKIDLRFLSQITVIPNTFLAECESLENIDLSYFNKVTKIGDEFLQYCKNLTDIDLNPLNGVTEIGKFFLLNCDLLENVYISPNSKFTEINSNCFSIITEQYNPIKKINLSSIKSMLNEIQKIMQRTTENKGVISIKLSDLVKINFYAEKIKSVNNNKQTNTDLEIFLKKVNRVIVPLEESYFYHKFQKYLNASSPQEKLYYDIDYVHPTLVNETGSDLENRSKLIGDRTVVLDCGNAHIIDDYCLKSISLTKEIVVIGDRVETIGNWFLNGNRSVERIDLSSLKRLNKIGISFISHTQRLEKINIECLKNVTDIPHSFMSFNKSLKSIDLSPLANVERIAPLFFSYCDNFESIDLSPLVNVQNIEDLMFSSCSQIKNFIIPTNWQFRNMISKSYDTKIIENPSVLQKPFAQQASIHDAPLAITDNSALKTQRLNTDNSSENELSDTESNGSTNNEDHSSDTDSNDSTNNEDQNAIIAPANGLNWNAKPYIPVSVH